MPVDFHFGLFVEGSVPMTGAQRGPTLPGRC